MAITKYVLAEQCLRKLSGGDRPDGSRFHMLEIQKAVEQAINSLIKPQYFSETLAGGETIPEGSILCEYTVPVISDGNGYSHSALPAIPVKLPKNMGVWRISKTGDVMQSSFVPIPQGLFEYVVSQRLISSLLGKIGYELRGGKVLYTQDLTALSPAISSVLMHLIVMDFSKYADTDLLPINADIEKQVVDMVVQSFAAEPKTPQTTDPTMDAK